MSDIALEEHVSSASSLGTEEKETALYFNGGREDVRVTTYQRGMITGLLKNEMFEVEDLILEDEDGGFHEADPGDYTEDMDDICGILGRLPMGSLTVKNTERSTSTPSGIVSTSTVNADTFE